MWRPVLASGTRRLAVGVQLEFRREINNAELESRRLRTKSGWWSRRGTLPGSPMVDPDHIRTIGVDKTLQERLDELFADEMAATKDRRDVGLPPPPPPEDKTTIRRVKMMEHQKQQRQNKELERLARLNQLEVDVDEVQQERIASGGLFQDLIDAADLYGIYEDLFGAGTMFTPRAFFRILYDLDDDHVLPVHRGNVIKPRDARSAPSFEFSSSDPGSRWTLVMTNPDGHFHEDEAEYLHWMVSNIPADGDLSKGDTVCHYLPPFPPQGTGFHRLVFILYKQHGQIDLSKYRQPQVEDGVDLAARTFRTHQFFGEHEGQITPAGLAFFQSDYDASLHQVFHDLLNMPEPKYEYNFAEGYVKPWDHMYDNKGSVSFNLFLDRFRDPKEVQEEVLKKRLKTLHPIEGDLDRQIKYPNVHEPRALRMKYNREMASWRVREIERERLRRGLYKDMDHFEPRRDPSNA